VRWAAVTALAGALLLSALLLPPVAAAGHVLALLAAWAYNLRLKDTAWSPLPYAVAFGAVPVVVAGVAERPAPAAGLVAAAGLAGVGAHLANTARDVVTDRAVGNGGAAARVGGPAARFLAVLAIGLAAAAALAWLAAPSPLVWWVLLAQVAVLAVAARARQGRWLFPTVLALAVLDTAAVVAAS
jgi:4-hydroxybenzoate polyprenyltransferase